MEDYLPLLVADASRARRLMNGLLVTVTSFFRDPEAFDALHDPLAEYVRRETPASRCASGCPGARRARRRTRSP